MTETLATVFVFLSGVAFGAALAFSARRTRQLGSLGDATARRARLRLVGGGRFSR